MRSKTLPYFLLLALIAAQPGAARLTDPGDAITESAQESEAHQEWLTDVDAAVQKAKDQDSEILVDLYAEWCGWCKVLEEKVFTTEEFQRRTSDFVLLRVDVEDGADGSALQARFGTRSLPTTLILSPEMVKIGAISGFLPTEQFLAAIDDQVDGYRRLVRSYENLRDSNDPNVLTMLAEALHARGDGSRAAQLYEQKLKYVDSAGDEAVELHYLIADASRIMHDWEKAQNSVERARSLTSGNDSHPYGERLDLLHARIAHERGDCDEATASWNHFLESHPNSPRREAAQRSLESLQQSDLCV